MRSPIVIDTRRGVIRWERSGHPTYGANEADLPARPARDPWIASRGSIVDRADSCDAGAPPVAERSAVDALLRLAACRALQFERGDDDVFPED